MRKRSSKKPAESEPAPEAAEQLPADPAPEPASEPPAKNPHAVALGRLGGKKGGPARAKKLTAEERSAIGRKAAAARWKKKH